MRPRNPYEAALATGAISPEQETITVGDYVYFAGGYIDPAGNIVYTGDATPAPWYLTWFVGLFP